MNTDVDEMIRKEQIRTSLKKVNTLINRIKEIKEIKMVHNRIVKDCFEKAISYENGTFIKIKITRDAHPCYSHSHPCTEILFCTVNDGSLNDILYIHNFNIATLKKIDKNDIDTYHKYKGYLRALFSTNLLWKDFTIEPYYRINSTMLPLNNDVCGLIEKKIGEYITFELKYCHFNFEIKDSIRDIPREVIESNSQIDNIIIRINPYDYKNFEVKFINMPEFKIINIDDLDKNIKNGLPDLDKLLDYTFRFDSI